MSASAPLLAFNCTAYDALPSGARARAVGLAAGLLELGAAVLLFVPPGLDLRAAVAEELGAPAPEGRLLQMPTPLDPALPALRAARSERWFRRHVPRQVDLFVTDYYPVLDEVRTALTVHDLRYMAAPGDEPRARVLWFRSMYAHVARRAPLLVVPTAQVGSECVFHLGVDAERVRVVGNAPGAAWRRAWAAPPEPPRHLLWWGTAERRKRLQILLRAYALASDGATLPPLVLAGRGGAPDALPEPGAELLAAGALQALGCVPDDELVALCRAAWAVLHPSRYEGFGLPVLEALSLGTPVLAAHTGAVEEVAGDAAYLLPTDDLAAWARGLRLATAGPARLPRPDAHEVAALRARTWRASAQALLAAL